MRFNVFVDDPPFFFRNSSSADILPDTPARQIRHPHPQLDSLPYRSQLIQLATQGSGVEDFRSVIDDLTVENKKLKTRLRRYGEMRNAHLQQDRLFEVRVYGLPVHKKKELEEVLRRFALSLDDDPANVSSVTGYDRFAPPRIEQHKTTSSYSSTMFADSAYASGSGHNSYPPSGYDNASRGGPKLATSRQQPDIQSYLRNIPVGLLPKHSIAMTEKARKKLVVRRLEQIFTGQGAATGGHQQPLQQQEVSQSAAKADRYAIEASGRRVREEGLREAPIMPAGFKDSMNPVIADQNLPECTQNSKPSNMIAEYDFARERSPDQRPTRPLDLDLHRAQVPTDNMQYIRHLGFSPPDVESAETPSDGHGWIYLNLVANMAQLHTLSVTTEFVKEAITEYSTKFELSHDGRKIRWRSGNGDVQINREDSAEDRHGNGSSDDWRDTKNTGRKRAGPAPTGNSESSRSRLRSARASIPFTKGHGRNELAYTPLFFQKTDIDEESSFSDNEGSRVDSDDTEDEAGDSSDLASSALRTPMSKKRHSNHGPMVFYKKARFYTDLSGDRSGRRLALPNSLSYNSLPVEPVGTTHNLPTVAGRNTEIAGSRGLLRYSSQLDGAMNLENVPSSSEEELTLSSGSAWGDVKSSSSFEAADFEVSGIGGVQPADHFAISVQSRRVVLEGPLPKAASHRHPKAYHSVVDDLIGQDEDGAARRQFISGKSTSIVTEAIVSTRRKDLPASTLPPASFYHFESPDDSDSDTESNVSEDPYSFSRSRPAVAPQLLHIATQSTDEPPLSDEECVDSDDSDGSIDLLATAREIDPEAIRAREREYDSNLAERLAEHIPAGSSAATAGGGSGFNSPASVIRDDGGEGRRPSAPRICGVKRARTGDNADVSGKVPRLE